MRTTLSLLRTRSGAATFRLVAMFCHCAAMAMVVSPLAAQPANNAQQNAFQNALVGPANGPGNAALFPPNNAAAGTNANNQLGGAANADFDSLIDLITSTIHPEMWADNGGPGDVRPFPGGVLVDAAGTLRIKSQSAASEELTALRGKVPAPSQREPRHARRASSLRYISLPRLEREIARRQAAHEPLDATMLALAGLQRVRYVFVYPKSGDLVLAGPAGDWNIDPDGRIVSTDTRQAVCRLDDLLVLLRRGIEGADSYFGCSINPRQESLARTQAFLASSSQQPLAPGQRKKWLATLRDNVGTQDIEVFGVDPASRVAGVLIEADYHMKLIGMGLVDGVAGVESYLDLIKARSGASRPPAMSVLRWWFTLNYNTIRNSPQADAFELMGQGVRVLSENEMLAAQGQRVHTGQSEPLNRQFAESFTNHFAELAAKYPVYSELRNIFDLAMAVALVEDRGLDQTANWQPGILASGERLRLPQSVVPRQVESVVSHRVINRRHVVAGVSGGVMVAPGDVLKGTRAATGGGTLSDVRRTAPKADSDSATWWWDAE